MVAMSAWAEERGCSDRWRAVAFARWAQQARATLHPDDRPALQLAEATRPLYHRGLLSAEEVLGLVQAAQTLEASFGNRRLTNQGTKIWYSSSHETLYLHHGGWFSHHFPSLLDRLVQTMRQCAALWHQQEACDDRAEKQTGDVEAASRLNVRCIELHTYVVGGALTMPAHRDSGSTISMSVLLSDAKTCDGGKFVTWSDKRHPVEHELQRGDAILFPSERIHNVSPVLAGQRKSLVFELWTGPSLERGRN